MKADCCLEDGEPVSQSVKDETKCTICESTVFRVCSVTSELIMLTCENCGEPHMIGINSDEDGCSLAFWSQEAGIED